MRTLWTALALVACRVPDVDLGGKQCPCADGYTCEAATNTCVLGNLADAPQLDAIGCPGFFCDGFESGDVSRWTATSITPTATLVPEAAIVHAGGFALDATVPAIANGSIAAVVERFPPMSSGLLAVRSWVYAAQPLIDFDSVITAFGAGPPIHVATVDADDTGHWTVTENGTGGADHHSTAVPLASTWQCVELDYTFGATARIQLFVSDVPVVDTPAVDTGATYTEVRVGVSRADAAGARAIVDDVVLATQHVGCD
jgi:hypothetical protein